MNKVKEQLTQGEGNKKMAKMLAYVWKMTMGLSVGNLWGDKENGTIINEDMIWEEMKENFNQDNDTLGGLYEIGKNASMIKLGMLLKKMSENFKKMIMKMAEKNDVSEMKGNVPDTLDKIMVKIYMEEAKDTMSSKKMMLKKLKMLKKLFSMIMDDESKKEALLMDQWIQFMKRIKEKVAEGNVNKDLAKLLAYMWEMTVGNDMGDLWVKRKRNRIR